VTSPKVRAELAAMKALDGVGAAGTGTGTDLRTDAPRRDPAGAAAKGPRDSMGLSVGLRIEYW
jgi:hypothetical protein